MKENMNKNNLNEIPFFESLISCQPQRLQSELFSQTYKCLNQAVALAKDGSGSQKAFLKFGMFCDESLRHNEAKSSSKKEENESLASAVISNFLEAMRRLSPGAVERFPRLLELLGTYPKVAKEFSQKVKAVPCWMFIRWISQMLALLDKTEGPSIAGILVEVFYYLSTQFRREREKGTKSLSYLFCFSLFTESFCN